MSAAITTIIIPVKDLDQAKGLYGKLLGAEPYADAPYYVGFRVGDQEIGLNPHGHAEGMTGPVGYVDVTDIQATIAELTAAGAQQQGDVRDVGAGNLVAVLADADGNPIGLRQKA